MKRYILIVCVLQIFLSGCQDENGLLLEKEFFGKNIVNPDSPILTCSNAINISQTTAEVPGNITNIGSSNVTQRGHCWATSHNPTTTDNITTLGPTSATGEFSSQLSGLMSNTTYYVRAYATNNSGTGYSTEQVFTTTSTPTIPTLTIDVANNITQTTASISGAISNLGSGGVIQHGHCWSTSTNPTISNSKTTLGATNSTGSFNSNLTNLAPATTYYIKAYAVNDAGIGYSSEVSLTTTSNPASPIVVTGSITNITITDASAAGSISDAGTGNITQHGHCWSTSQNPNINNSKTQLGNGSVGDFSSNLTQLSENTSYYVRAYATNGTGTGYGSQQIFTTMQASLPILTTTDASNITGNSAVSGGTISSTGGGTITDRGVCWSTDSNPTTSDSYTSSGSGSGSFISNITGLYPTTTYFVRAFATNSTGTAYGNQMSFITPALLTVGQNYDGGMIFYIDGTGQHGLIAASFDQSTSAQWGCNGASISGADGIEIGTGLQNTLDIIAGCPESGIAARLCYDLVLNGFDDWYLPSKNELNLMYVNLHAQGLGGFATSTYYWSSSEENAYNAYDQKFSPNGQFFHGKSINNYVRAIRSF